MRTANTPRTEREYRVACLEATRAGERIPGRDRGARQRCPFLERKMIRKPDQRVLMQSDALRHHAVQRAANLGRILPGNRTVDPARKHRCSDPIANPHPCDARPQRYDLAVAVGAHDDVALDGSG